MTLLEEGGLNLGPLLPEHWQEMAVGIVLFLLVWWVLAKKVVPVFEKTYQERTEAIQGGIDKAEKAQAEAAAALKEYQEKLAGARAEAAQIREQANKQAEDLAEQIKKQAQDESARIIANAKAAIEAEKTAALRELRGEIGGIATELAGKIVGEVLSDDQALNKQIDRFLDEIEAERAAS
ncbi:MAG: F0F1 ATP synthase subunit B [Propionibacteriaceae bacterium]|jgi:F-type H+-transporting ATPase subunit b|nr:F0F1 ATP synthase subunit B [Propionibacteriaceae bacterium]